MNFRRDRFWLGFLLLLALASASWARPFQDAHTQFQQGDYQGALASLQKAQQQDSNNPLVYAALGNTYRKLNDSEDALKAYNRVLEIDPNLASIPQKSAFAQAYQAVGGDPTHVNTGGGQAFTGTPSNDGSASPTDVINALSSNGVYVAPGLKKDVDANRIADAVAKSSRPVKVAVVGHLGGYPTRAALADDLRKRLDVPDDGVVLVVTPQGISGASKTLTTTEIDQALQKAGIDQAFAKGGLTAASVAAIGALTGSIAADQQRQKVTVGMWFVITILLVIVVLAIRASGKKRVLETTRGPIEAARQKIVTEFTYVDGYLDLLPAGDETTRARQERATAYERYSTANGVLKVGATPAELSRALPLLQEADALLTSCRQKIDRITGGTGVAMGIMETPSLATDEQKGRAYLAQTDLKPVETVGSAVERDRLQRELDAIPASDRGVSFFSGRPMPASQLTPVTMVIGGQKRTVMASRDEADAIARGERPPIRAFADSSGGYTPWYEYRGYDPYRDYYGGWGGNGLGNLVDLYLLTNLMGPSMWGGYGPWGYGGFGWGMPMPAVVINDGPGFFGGYDDSVNGGFVGDGFAGNAGDNGGYFGGDGANVPADPANTGGVDFFGQQGYGDQGAGFDTTPTGGDTGGGGFDFGGGGDSGGGGFDFGGGGDSGGGFDFGGGGDSGGGGDF